MRFEYVQRTVQQKVNSYYNRPVDMYDPLKGDFHSLCLVVTELEDELGIAITVPDQEGLHNLRDLIYLCYIKYNELMDMEGGGLRIVSNIYLNLTRDKTLEELERHVPIYPIVSERDFRMYENISDTLLKNFDNLTDGQKLYFDVLQDALAAWEIIGAAKGESS